MLFNFFNIHKMFLHVDDTLINQITWNNGTLKEKALMLWDLENINYRYFQDIKRKLHFTPIKAYIVTKQHLGDKKLNSMKKNGFEVFVKHSSDSDTKIKQIYNILKDYNEFVIVSSDSDFIDIGKKILSHNKKLIWIVHNANKKRVMMKMDISNKNLKIITLGQDVL